MRQARSTSVSRTGHTAFPVEVSDAQAMGTAVRLPVPPGLPGLAGAEGEQGAYRAVSLPDRLLVHRIDRGGVRERSSPARAVSDEAVDGGGQHRRLVLRPQPRMPGTYPRPGGQGTRRHRQAVPSRPRAEKGFPDGIESGAHRDPAGRVCRCRGVAPPPPVGGQEFPACGHGAWQHLGHQPVLAAQVIAAFGPAVAEQQAGDEVTVARTAGGLRAEPGRRLAVWHADDAGEPRAAQHPVERGRR